MKRMKNQAASPESDNLSDFKGSLDTGKLDHLVAGLAESMKDSTVMERETELRARLIEVRERLGRCRYDMGEVLASYRELYKMDRTWSAFCAAVGVNVRTASRMIEGFNQAKKVPPVVREQARKRGTDLAEKKHRPILDKLIGISKDQVLDQETADAALDQAEAEARKHSRSTSSSPMTAEQRVDKAYRYLTGLYGEVEQDQRGVELKSLFCKVATRYSLGEMRITPAASPAQVSVSRTRREAA